ncbi:hypothetical protein A3B35_01180 [Candidatus Kaiserbacteria bacterium RIFCSPLOWO2_01_FULL_54_24]|uniref:acylphosphatase n=1 Tax=Candidatus Kaiserbacteria bacterium RIFCSPLOWO2_01_FULL_54_24 TaxID=1798515 RepID=A0A1F6EW53_9BACT|nr:MAG: hypothetical protein A3B35_01180 [Candidatus Kaiserbacteria bacterium RIFCSPLOWO2_01_FULL_54_24]
MDVEEVKCIVSGKVQGVFYRDFVAKHARHLAIAGYVRNAPDFKVEVVAQGYRDKLDKLIEHLHKGPFLARVSKVDVEWRELSEKFGSFDVVF